MGARDYVEGMWRIMQADKPSDYVLATGETHTVRSFCDTAFKVIGVDITWEGEDEVGISSKTGKPVVMVDPAYFRPPEVELLLGDPAKAKAELGWEPTVTFSELVEEMVRGDMEAIGS